MCVCVFCACARGECFTLPALIMSSPTICPSIDERIEKIFNEVVKDLSEILRDPLINWNETKGYECEVNRSYGIPVRAY